MRTIVIACSLLFIAASAMTQQNPTCSNYLSGPNFRGKDLKDRNFSHQDLSNANFTGAILDGAQFVGANLRGANFSRASLKKSVKGAANFLNANLTRTCFRDTTLEGANLQFTTVSCADFSQSNLTAALFSARPTIDPREQCRTKFVNATMKIDQFPTSLWGRADFTNTNFVDLTPQSISLRGVDITGAILVGIKLGGFDLTDSTLTGVDFTSADLRTAKLDRAKASGVKMNGAQLSEASAIRAQFYDPGRPDVKSELRGATAVHVNFSNANLSYADLRGANFSASNFQGATLDNAVLQPGDRLNATQIGAANFTGATFRSAHLNNVSFRGTRLVDTTFRGEFANTDFSESILTGAKFETSTVLQGVNFRKSTLQNVSFANTKMQPWEDGTPINFTCAYLGGANFSGADITTAWFNAAVMPQPGDCCRQRDGTFYCGTDAFTRLAYGPTSLPSLKEGVVVTCPNGEQARCSGAQWSMPNWQSRACNLQGTLETIWTPPRCGGDGGGDVVNIPDAQLLECLRVAFFGSSQGQIITKEFANTVSEIQCPGRGIQNVAGLDAFTALRKLDLSNNEIVDGTIYSALRRLEMLNLARNKLKELSFSHLTALEHLDASRNQIAGINGWIHARALQHLDLSHNNLMGALNLGIRESLTWVDLSHNRLTAVVDRQPMSKLTSLEYLDLQNNALKTVGSLKTLTSTLRHLNLACNPEFDCASMELDGTPLLENSLCGKPCPR